MKLGKYKHFKGGLYEIIGIAKDSETLKDIVIYKNLYNHPKFGKNCLWVRSKKMFLETVKKEGKNISRFKYIGK